MDEIKLKPCPFCGAVPKYPDNFMCLYGGSKWGAVVCDCTEVRTGFSEGPAPWAEAAAAEWNRRSATDGFAAVRHADELVRENETLKAEKSAMLADWDEQHRAEMAEIEDLRSRLRAASEDIIALTESADDNASLAIDRGITATKFAEAMLQEVGRVHELETEIARLKGEKHDVESRLAIAELALANAAPPDFTVYSSSGDGVDYRPNAGTGAVVEDAKEDM